MPTVPGGARVVFNWVASGRERAAVLHTKKVTGDYSLIELLNLAVAFKLVWDNTWKLGQANDLVLQDVTATSLRGSSSEQFVAPCTTNCGGSVTTQALPGNVTSTTSWRTTGIGRRKRGRTFNPGYVTTDVNENDTVSSGKLTQLAVIADALLQAGQTSSGNLGVFSRVANEITLISSYILENLLDSQRDRLTGRGT